MGLSIKLLWTGTPSMFVRQDRHILSPWVGWGIRAYQRLLCLHSRPNAGVWPRSTNRGTAEPHGHRADPKNTPHSKLPDVRAPQAHDATGEVRPPRRSLSPPSPFRSCRPPPTPTHPTNRRPLPFRPLVRVARSTEAARPAPAHGRRRADPSQVRPRAPPTRHI